MERKTCLTSCLHEQEIFKRVTGGGDVERSRNESDEDNCEDYSGKLTILAIMPNGSLSHSGSYCLIYFAMRSCTFRAYN